MTNVMTVGVNVGTKSNNVDASEETRDWSGSAFCCRRRSGQQQTNVANDVRNVDPVIWNDFHYVAVIAKNGEKCIEKHNDQVPWVRQAKVML